MNEIRVPTVSALIERLNSYPNSVMFRGHSSADYQLESSLERIIGGKPTEQEVTKLEKFSLMRFESKYHLYDVTNRRPSSKLGWLSLMQHYGVPTRLLDFTTSPYVALYFCIESAKPKESGDYAIYALDYTQIMKTTIERVRRFNKTFIETPQSIQSKNDKIFEEVADAFNQPVLWVAEPSQLNRRLDRQAGTFLFSGDLGMRVDAILESEEYASLLQEKLLISRSLYEGIFSLLRKMNVTSKTIYGDLEGLAKEVKMELAVYAS